MSDRTLDDCTKRSRKLARLSKSAFGLFSYIFQETCDYGRILADSKYIKGQRFSLVDWITPNLIEKALLEYNKVGSLFLWDQDGQRYGFFVGFEAKSGRFLSKRRKSPYPEPPAELLAKYLQDNNRCNSLLNTSLDGSKSQPKERKKGNERKENKEDIVELFNSTCPSLPKVRILSKTRQKKLDLRLEEHPDLDWWKSLFEKVEKTPFVLGENERGWKASFDWLIENDRNALKVLEGNYDRKQKERTWRDE